MCKLQKSEQVFESEKRKYNLFDDVIEKKLGCYLSYLEETTPEIYILYEDDYEEDTPSLLNDSDTVEFDGTAELEKPVTDNLIHAEVNLPQGEKIQGTKLIGHTKYPNGDTVGNITTTYY